MQREQATTDDAAIELCSYASSYPCPVGVELVEARQLGGYKIRWAVNELAALFQRMLGGFSFVGFSGLYLPRPIYIFVKFSGHLRISLQFLLVSRDGHICHSRFHLEPFNFQGTDLCLGGLVEAEKLAVTLPVLENLADLNCRSNEP